MKDFIVKEAHNIALLALLALGYAAKEQLAGPVLSLVVVILFFVLPVFLSYVFVRALERAALLGLYGYFVYVGIDIFASQYLGGAVSQVTTPQDAFYFSACMWSGLGFEDLKPIAAVRPWVTAENFMGLVGNAGLVAMFIRFCMPTEALMRGS